MGSGISGLGMFRGSWIDVVVRIMVPFWIPTIIRHLIFRVPKGFGVSVLWALEFMVWR